MRVAWLRILVIVIIFLAVTGIMSVTSTSREQVSRFELVFLEVVSPLKTAVSEMGRVIKDGTGMVVEIWQIRQENARLREELRLLESDLYKLYELGRDNEILREMLGFEKREENKVTLAKVIGRSPNNWAGSITINKGSDHGVETDMAVVTPDGIVGRIKSVTKRTSTVILLTDNQSSIGGMIEKSWHPVLVEGMGDPSHSEAKVRLLVWEADLKPGDIIVTSGLSLIFPQGLPVGVIEEVRQSQSGLAPYGILRPYADLIRLDWVIIVCSQEVSEGEI